MSTASFKTVNDGVPGLTLSDIFASGTMQQEMAEAWKAYIGQLPPALKNEPNQPDINVSSNRLAPIVDTGLYYLFGLPLKIEVEPSGTDPDTGKPAPAAQDEDAQDYLDKCMGDEDDWMTMLSKLAMNGAIFGHAFAMLIPPNKAAGADYPHVTVLNPQNLRVITDPDDCDVVHAYVIQYDTTSLDGTAMTKRKVISRVDPDQLADVTGLGYDLDDSWTITNSVRIGTGGFVQVAQPQVWPHPWPPIVDCQNLPVSNQHWGQPDVTPDLIQLNKVLNFVLSNINSIGHSHGHPWVWTNSDTRALTIAPGRIIGLPGPDAKLNALVANGDISGLMNFAADLRADMDEQSKVPGVATGRIAELPKGNMSGVALRMLYQPLLFKTNAKRRTYGRLIRDLCTRMLALGGFGDGTDANGVKVTTHWKDPMPQDDLAEAQVALAWNQLGVSTDTLLAQAGFDPDMEASKNEQASARQMQLQSQGQAPLMPPPPPTDPNAAQAQPPAQPGQTPPNAPPPPVNHPAAIRARQSAQAAAGKPVTANGM